MISDKGKKYVLLLSVEESFEDTFLHIFKNTSTSYHMATRALANLSHEGAKRPRAIN